MLLVIDSATAACSAALIEGDGALVAELYEEVGRGHAERLLPMIRDLLDGLRPDDILVDCGPGSFTGVRVGLAAAHGLAIGWGLSPRGYSSMAVVAAQLGEQEVAVALHGGHGELFVQSFGADPLRPLDALQSLAPDAAAAAITTELVAGSGAEALVAARGWGRVVPLLPRAAGAARLPRTLASLPPRPIYGRAPDARPVNA